MCVGFVFMVVIFIVVSLGMVILIGLNWLGIDFVVVIGFFVIIVLDILGIFIYFGIVILLVGVFGI